MEEKYDQIEMDVELSSLPDQKEQQSEADVQDVFEIEAPQQDAIANMEDSNIAADDDIELISPDVEVFERASDNSIANTKAKKSAMAEWTQHAFKPQENEQIEYDEAYANTSRGEHDFMKAFGIADKSGKSLNLDDSLNPSTAEIESLQGDIHSDYYEYTDRQQRKEIMGMYKYAKRSIRTKMILCGIITLFLLFIENITLFSKTPSGIFSAVEHPYMHFLFDFVLVALAAACAYEQLYHGIRSIISKEFIPEAISVFAVGASMLYAIFTIIFIPFYYIPNAIAPVFYNFPVSIICFMSIAFSYINVVRERYSFSIVSSKDSKFVLNKISTDDAEAETEAFSTASKDFVGDLIRIDKTEFVKKYFARTNRSVSTMKVMYPYYVLAICVPLIMSIISIFRGEAFMSAMSNWFAGAMMVMPVGVLFMFSVPFLIGNKRLFEEETTIVGEDTIDEYADSKAVSVNDTTAFPPYNVKLQNLHVYNEINLEKVLYYAANGFNTVGGPLSEVFELATKDAFTKSKRSRFVCSGRSYLCVKVDNDTIIFADRYGITSQGIDVPAEREELDEDVSVMYMACNGKLCARMHIKYEMDDDFTQTVKNLNKNDVCVGIRTFDPNINNDLIRRQSSLKKADLRVIRLTKQDEIPTTIEKADSGVVSKGHSKSLIKAIPVCKNISKIRKVGLFVSIIASLVGAVLIGMSMFGAISVISSLLVVLYYSAWLAVMLVSTVVLLQ